MFGSKQTKSPVSFEIYSIVMHYMKWIMQLNGLSIKATLIPTDFSESKFLYIGFWVERFNALVQTHILIVLSDFRFLFLFQTAFNAECFVL